MEGEGWVWRGGVDVVWGGGVVWGSWVGVVRGGA